MPRSRSRAANTAALQRREARLASRHAGKFKARYQTLGFSDKANLDDGSMWPNSYALMKLTATEEAKITALVKRAVRREAQGGS
jgi:hypothetical protein